MPGEQIVAAPSTAVVTGSDRAGHLQAALEASSVWVQLAGPGQVQEHIEREVGMILF